ncbi:MAG: glycosyltransferase family 39 protein [Calditerrivibrio sp.]|nr:glycosyltransferase family 39 protein [Calditerrivibrio sp.]
MIFYLIISLYTSAFTPLFESTEVRYAEIAREMLERGDFIEPHFNGIKHFHKPPFAYWMIALGMKLFGINNFGARFFGILASLFVLFFTFKLSKFFVHDDNEKFVPGYILGSSILFLSVSRIVATDIYLSLFVVITLYYYFKQIYEDKNIKNAIFIGFSLGLGFLTKGPVVFIFTLLPYFVLKIFNRDFRKVFDVKSVVISIAVFLMVVTPWFLIVIWKNTELSEYFLKVQTVDRVVTNRFNRNQPFYFFFITVFWAVFPFIVLLLFTFKKILVEIKRFQVLIVFIIVPFVIFSLAKSKLHSYLTPMVPLLCIFVYLLYKDISEKWFEKFLLFLSVVLSIVFLGSCLYFKVPIDTMLITLFIGVVLIIFYMIRSFSSHNFIFLYGLLVITLFSAAYYLAGFFQEKLMGFENMVRATKMIDPYNKLEVLCYKRDLTSFSFYRNKIAVMAMGNPRETQFQRDLDYKKVYLQSELEIFDFIKKNNSFFLFTRGNYDEFRDKFSVQCNLIFKQRDYHLYICKG